MRKACWLVWSYLVPASKLIAQINPVYQPLQVDIGIGLAILQNRSTGGEVKINPAYSIAGRFKVGVQFEEVVYNEWSAGSSMLTFDYYFIRKSEFRISAGGGYGFYQSSYFFQTSEPPDQSQAQWTSGKMGGMVRMVFVWHHLSLEIAYTFAPTLYVSTSLIGYPTTTDGHKNGFLGLTLGLMIGGGKK